MALQPSPIRDLPVAAPPAAADSLARFARLAARCLGAPLAVLSPGESLEQCWWYGIGDAPAGPPPRWRELLAGVVEAAEPVVLEEGSDELALRRAGGASAGAVLGVPLPARGGGVRGVLAVLAPEPRRWTPAEVEMLQELAAAAAERVEQQDPDAAALARALAESEERYRRLTSTSLTGVFFLDTTGTFREVNRVAEEIAGLPADQILGRRFADLLAPEDEALAREIFSERVAGGWGRALHELRVVRPSGERRLVQIHSVPALSGGRVVGVYGVARDISGERAREVQLRRAQRMASVAPLLTGVCHELNNPLTSIKSFAELLLLDERSEGDCEALEIIQREAHRAAKIVTDLRVVARQTQEAGTGRELVNLSELLGRVVEQRAPVLQAGGIVLEQELSPTLLPVWAVRSQMEQVILHLLRNAEQALASHPGERRLRVRTYSASQGAALHVEDTGPGIPEADQERIFDPFWTTKAPGEGTGLGLSLVHGIVTDHGGQIHVASPPGCGAAFTVELPAHDHPPVGLGDSGQESASSRPLRLLVVDDEAPIRHSLVRYMERRGHQVDAASEGGEALRFLEQAGADYDVILADLRMPGLNGQQLFERMRQRGDDLEQRLVFITGDADSPDVAPMLHSAGVPVVLKPFALAEIAQIIETQAGIARL